MQTGTKKVKRHSNARSLIEGKHIVILDRGFVYVGSCRKDGDVLCIDGAKNIRRWGTTNGLGELRNGPLATTVLDVVGTVLAPWHSVQHLIPCVGF